ncbi:MAG: hypothetical protein HC871_17775, partial [Rhizobiales bacterium]|nr:hypothetical protein [Hyphomicrobiales bacterium]
MQRNAKLALRSDRRSILARALDKTGVPRAKIQARRHTHRAQGLGWLAHSCLGGAFCGDTAANWSDWIADLSRRFPEADIAVVNGFYYYWPEEAEVMQQIIAEGRTLLADGRPTVIVAFSFGAFWQRPWSTRAIIM